MGIIDTATITLTCPGCGLVEASRILDKGNAWSGSHWGLPSFTKFDVTLTGGGKTEPDVEGTCFDCGTSARVSTAYAT